MELHKLELTDLSAIQYRLARVTQEGRSLLVAAFIGEYRRGSLGNTDAHFMKAVIAGATSAWGFHAIVLDLRELSYVWGNPIVSVIQQGLPVTIVASDRCAPALRGLGCELFTTLQEAVAEAWRRALKRSGRSDELEDATLVIAVGKRVKDPLAAVAKVAVRVGFAASFVDDVSDWEGGSLQVRVETVEDLPEVQRLAAVEGAIAYFDFGR